MVTPIESLCGVPGAAAAVINLSQDLMAYVFPEVAASRLIKDASGARLAYPSDAVIIGHSLELVFIGLRGGRSETISILYSIKNPAQGRADSIL